MQVENETSWNFSKRTDALAHILSVDLGALATMLDMGRASFFSYRTGKRPISGKAWAKLDAAEQAAGIGIEPPAQPNTKSLAVSKVENRDSREPRSIDPILESLPRETLGKLFVAIMTKIESTGGSPGELELARKFLDMLDSKSAESPDPTLSPD